MAILVTGANGQLGYDVCRELARRDIPYIGATRVDFDICNTAQLEGYIRKVHPQAVVHCAAYTQVDRAETEDVLCTKTNAEATRTLALLSAELRAKMVYISSDYIFDGAKTKEYHVTDEPHPLNVYGRTKLLGEDAIRESLKEFFILRASWVFGINGSNFVKTMLKLAQTHHQVSVVCDQVGAPTYTVDLAQLICNMLETDRYGTYHVSNTGFCSWADFAEEIFRQEGQECTVCRIPTHAYLAKAARPLNSRMSTDSLVKNGFAVLPVWQDALYRYLKELKDTGDCEKKQD